MSVNKVIILGNVGKDPEIRSTQNGKEIANLSIATSQKWKDKQTQELKEKTEWHKVVIFNEGLVKVVKSYVKKGSKLYVEGALQTRKWQDQQGNEKYVTEVVLQGFNSSLKLLDSRNNQQASTAPAYNEPSQDVSADFAADGLDDEIPF